MEQLTPSELRDWLEWAGGRLMGLNVGRIKPAEPKVIWPEYSQEVFQVLEFRTAGRTRIPSPSAPEIPIMDLILTFPNLCSQETTRRILHCRLLVNPLNNKHVLTWAKIAQRVESDPRTVMSRYKRGLEEAASKAPSDSVCRIRGFLSPAA